MIEIDARGLSCPIPVVRTKRALDRKPEKCCVLVDAYVQVENIRRLAESAGYTCAVKQEGDIYRVIVTRKEAGNA
jgi:tRNA 2-thiouridine synthesizing protein A